MILYFDESGNSGENLLDVEQPIFVLVSHNISEEESLHLLEKLDSNSKEIHFKKIRKYPKHHKPLVTFLNDDLIDYSRVKIAFYHKKFALCAHLVDQLAETYYYHKGINLYGKGLNILYANTLYMYCGFFDLQEEFNQLILSFQKMFREKTEKSISNFYLIAEKIKKKITKKGDRLDFIISICDSKKYINEILASEMNYRMELTMPSITLLSDIWHKESKQKIEIIHDESKSLEEWEGTIMELSNPNITPKKIGLDKRTMNFPLAITSINRVDSRKYPQIQVADLIGSSFAYYAKNILLEKNEDDQLAKLILSTKLSLLPVHQLSPDFNFKFEDYE